MLTPYTHYCVQQRVWCHYSHLHYVGDTQAPRGYLTFPGVNTAHDPNYFVVMLFLFFHVVVTF